MEFILLHGLLDPLSQLGLLEGDEELVLGRLEVRGRALRLAIKPQFALQLPKAPVVAAVVFEDQVWRADAHRGVQDQAHPAPEEGALGQPGRISFLLENNNNNCDYWKLCHSY